MWQLEGRKIIPVMKKLLLLAAVLMLSIAMNAQEDVTKFLGIPVDGTKSEMIDKLLDKGFTRTEYDRETLEGEFNGEPVSIIIQTVNNKVWRIIVSQHAMVDETAIRIRYNNLCDQFADNPNYYSFTSVEECYIPEGEDIAYEMSVKNKSYQSIFFQTNLMTVLDKAKEILSSKYSKALLANPTEDVQKELSDLTYDLLVKKSVWFTIQESYGEYHLGIFYENGYNAADGSDL